MGAHTYCGQKTHFLKRGRQPLYALFNCVRTCHNNYFIHSHDFVADVENVLEHDQALLLLLKAWKSIFIKNYCTWKCVRSVAQILSCCSTSHGATPFEGEASKQETRMKEEIHIFKVIPTKIMCQGKKAWSSLKECCWWCQTFPSLLLFKRQGGSLSLGKVIEDCEKKDENTILFSILSDRKLSHVVPEISLVLLRTKVMKEPLGVHPWMI